MSDKYLPYPSSLSNVENLPESDLEFAEAFKRIAELCDSHPDDSDGFTLWLSTCRNEQLMINGMYKDIANALQPKKRESPLLEAILFYLKVGKLREALRAIKQIKNDIMPALKAKQEVWTNRYKLNEHLTQYLNQQSGTERRRIREVLDGVHTMSADQRSQWPREFLEIRLEEHNYLNGFRREICDAVSFLDGFRHVTEKILALLASTKPDELAMLFEQNVPKLWRDLIESLKVYGASLGASLVEDGSGATLKIVSSGNSEQMNLPAEISEVAEIGEHISKILTILEWGFVVLEERMTKSFHKVETTRSMPPPYIVDLRGANNDELIEARQISEVIDIECVSERPGAIKLMLVGAHAATAFYRHREVDFDREEGGREIFFRVAKESIQLAVAAGAQGIVFPEAFIPRLKQNELCEFAREKGIALIGGVEPGVGVNRQIENFAIFQDASTDLVHRQFKRFPSGDEPEALRFVGGQKIFRHSSLGNFSILVCSDFQQLPPISAIASSGVSIDMIIATSATPYPEFQEQLAIADSGRFHCYVAMTNTMLFDETDAPAQFDVAKRQMVVMRPGKSAKQWKLYPVGEAQEIHGHKIEGKINEKAAFAASLYELRLSDLAHDRSKPTKSLMAKPASRSTKSSGK